MRWRAWHISQRLRLRTRTRFSNSWLRVRMDPSLRHARVDLFLPRGVTCGSVFLRLSFPFPSRFRVDLFVATKVAFHPSSRRSSRHDPLVSPNDVSLVPCHPPNDKPPLWQKERPTCPSKGPGEFLLQLGGFGGVRTHLGEETQAKDVSDGVSHLCVARHVSTPSPTKVKAKANVTFRLQRGRRKGGGSARA